MSRLFKCSSYATIVTLKANISYFSPSVRCRAIFVAMICRQSRTHHTHRKYEFLSSSGSVQLDRFQVFQDHARFFVCVTKQPREVLEKGRKMKWNKIVASSMHRAWLFFSLFHFFFSVLEHSTLSTDSLLLRDILWYVCCLLIVGVFVLLERISLEHWTASYYICVDNETERRERVENAIKVEEGEMEEKIKNVKMPSKDR